MFTGFKSFFKSYSTQTRKECNYCGGGRCMGMCGGTLAKLNKVKVLGVLQAIEADGLMGIMDGEHTLMTFDPHTHFGRMIMKKCSIGQQCKIEALTQGVKMERLISAKKIKGLS